MLANPYGKNEKVAGILDAILTWADTTFGEEKCNKMALGITPRFNEHIKHFVYLAQAHGDDKILYQKMVETGEPGIGRLPENNIYTEGYEFFLGFEFDKYTWLPKWFKKE